MVIFTSYYCTHLGDKYIYFCVMSLCPIIPLLDSEFFWTLLSAAVDPLFNFSCSLRFRWLHGAGFLSTYWSHTEFHWSQADTGRCSQTCTRPPYRFLHYSTETCSSLEEADRETFSHSHVIQFFRTVWIIWIWSIGCDHLCMQRMKVWFWLMCHIWCLYVSVGPHLQLPLYHSKNFFLQQKWFYAFCSHFFIISTFPTGSE